jgi:hypothetical protein
MRNFCSVLLPGVVVALMSGCASQTLFRSNFDEHAVGHPPGAAQAVGTANIDGPHGAVTVVDPPVQPSGKWLRISRQSGPQTAGFQGKFSEFKGDGQYTFTAAMFLPTNAGVATIQFEPFTNGASDLNAFLHLDFTENNTVRIDDSVSFGSFLRDEPFIVQVRLDIKPGGSTARIALSGAGASGEHAHTILTPFQNLSRQFGAVRVWQGFPHTGAFNATNIVVRLKTQ